mmetsp:Transcript_1673/g.2281  ORF Transcript_1673/g.2281 Transcript_1673/m.2281 type:complete len:543 (+) Transcript_1673:364-1992(+)|eukprot:CAMPEP_0178918692 /NCGR_PEP_ID=MMETSP0786-20121207/13965_1 /TAXON_ID=186022 /ORGANISM="Thalassionema frauenfeldii, Strain CCMP 1798" /LENGTH=542 /DNA_ID=CAMNT_0020592425 /DNA_START=249 /DNA_END=1877 /DNA_ORIENTATION=+
MAEVMISDRHRDSLQSLSLESLDSMKSDTLDQSSPSKNKEQKRVKHGPTTVIQIPEKRRKISTSSTTEQVVEALSRAISDKDRREAVCAATTTFDHNMQSLHDEELEFGADAALTKHLGFLMSKKVLQSLDTEPSMMHELSCTCEALEMIYRASPSSVSVSFGKIGHELMALLINLISDELGNRGKNQKTFVKLEEQCESASDEALKDNAMERQNTSIDPFSFEMCPPITEESSRRDNDIMLRKATKLMGHFARVGDATQSIAYYPGLLKCLIAVLMVRPYVSIPAELRLNALWIIANLACNSENMVMMACQPNLISALVALAKRKTHCNDSAETAIEIFRSHSIAARALLNLSWSPENRIPMSENIDLLEALSPLAVFRQSPFGKRGRTVKAMMLQTRKHCLGALRNLAGTPRRYKIHLCTYTEGKLLNVLTDAALNDPDHEVKERAFATIQNLAVHDTAELIVQNPALILALKDALLSNKESAIKSSASATMMVLERSITPDMIQYQTLSELVESINPDSPKNDDDDESEEAHEVEVTSV